MKHASAIGRSTRSTISWCTRFYTSVDNTTTTRIITWHTTKTPQMELLKMLSCVEKPEKGFATLQQAGKQLEEVRPTRGNNSLKRWSISIQGARSKDLACNKQEKLRSASGSWQRLKRWCSISIQAARSKDLATEVTDKNDSRASGLWLPWSSRERQWATSLMDSWIFSVRSRSCSNDRWSCRTIASKADLEKEESCHQQ